MPDEYGMQTIVTDRMLKAMHNDVVMDKLQRMACESMVRRFIIDGKQAVDLHEYRDYDPALRAWEISSIAEVEDDPRTSSLLAKMEERERNFISALLTVNSIPWWRLLWFKLRRREIVRVG